MSKKIYLAILLSVLLALPSVAFAQGPWGEVDWEGGLTTVVKIFFGPNIPVEFLENPYMIVRWLIFPFLALFVVIFGILSEIRIFRRGQTTRAIIAFLIAIIAAPTGALVMLVNFLFALYGGFAILVFIGLLFVGTILWAWASVGLWGLRKGEWKGAGKRMERQIKRQDKIRQLQRMAADRSLPESERKEAAKEAQKLIKEEEAEFG